MFSNSRQNPVLDMSEQMRTTERSVSGAQLQRASVQPSATLFAVLSVKQDGRAALLTLVSVRGFNLRFFSYSRDTLGRSYFFYRNVVVGRVPQKRSL